MNLLACPGLGIDLGAVIDGVLLVIGAVAATLVVGVPVAMGAAIFGLVTALDKLAALLR